MNCSRNGSRWDVPGAKKSSNWSTAARIGRFGSAGHRRPSGPGPRPSRRSRRAGGNVDVSPVPDQVRSTDSANGLAARPGDGAPAPAAPAPGEIRPTGST